MKRWLGPVFWCGLSCALCGNAGQAIGQRSLATELAMRQSAAADPAGPNASVPTVHLADAVSDPPSSAEAALRQMFEGADTVFTGEVTRVERQGDSMLIRWQIEVGIRGADAGAVYTLREWCGLWSGGPRYQVGERALVLLHAPSVAGYASPVGGSNGVLPLRGDAGTNTIDLRWVAQQVAVTDQSRLRPLQALQTKSRAPLTTGDVKDLPAVDAGVCRRRLFQAPENTAPEIGGMDITPSVTLPINAPTNDVNAHVDGAMILGMLRAWQRGGGGTR